MTSQQRRTRRRGSRNAEESASNQANLASPYIRRLLSYFDPLSEEHLVELEAQVDWLIENIGIEFRDDPEALRIWASAGAEVRGARVKPMPS